MKNLINLKSMIVALVMATCAMGTVSCGDDDEEPGREDCVPHFDCYEGKCIVSSQMNGREVLRDTIDTQVALVTMDDKCYQFQTGRIDSLYIPMTRMSIVMPDFFIDSLEIDGNHFFCESYYEKNVECSINGRDSLYEAVGKIDGIFKDGNIDVTYDFKLGVMPLSIKMEFTGKESKK